MKISDTTSFEFDDIEYDFVSEVEFTTDLGDLVIQNQVDETFDEFLAGNTGRKDGLYKLNRIRLMMRENGCLRLNNTYPGAIDDGYLSRLEILLNKAGFVDLRMENPANPRIIRAVRRALVSVPLDYGLILREVINPDTILECHEFAREYYYFKDFNYDLNVVRAFDLNCDLFAVYDESDKIYSLSRIVIRTPGYYCPFMYATVEGENRESHFSIPGKDRRIGEIMSIYSAGKKGVVAFKRMMEYMTQYGTDIAHFDSVWTTYDEEDVYTGTYYKNKFLMEDMGIQLKYGDFGGMWRLLFTDKIGELKELHHQIFRQRQE